MVQPSVQPTHAFRNRRQLHAWLKKHHTQQAPIYFEARFGPGSPYSAYQFLRDESANARNRLKLWFAYIDSTSAQFECQDWLWNVGYESVLGNIKSGFKEPVLLRAHPEKPEKILTFNNFQSYKVRKATGSLSPALRALIARCEANGSWGRMLRNHDGEPDPELEAAIAEHPNLVWTWEWLGPNYRQTLAFDVAKAPDSERNAAIARFLDFLRNINHRNYM